VHKFHATGMLKVKFFTIPKFSMTCHAKGRGMMPAGPGEKALSLQLARLFARYTLRGLIPQTGARMASEVNKFQFGAPVMRL
jgi:hypothetical protein